MNNINLVPVQYEKSFQRKWYIVGGVFGGILLIGLLAFLAYLPRHKINMAQKEQMDLNIKLSSEVLMDVRSIMEELSLAEKEKSNLELNLKKMDTPSHVSRKTMDIIVGNAPKGIRINQITIDRLSNTTNIMGNAESVTNVAQYMVGLNNTNQFKDITYSTNQNKELETKWNVEYTIEIQLKPFEEEVVEAGANQVDETVESDDTDEMEGEDAL